MRVGFRYLTTSEYYDIMYEGYWHWTGESPLNDVLDDVSEVSMSVVKKSVLTLPRQNRKACGTPSSFPALLL